MTDWRAAVCCSMASVLEKVGSKWYSPFFSAKAMASSLVEKDSNMLDKGSPLGGVGGRERRPLNHNQVFSKSNDFSFVKAVKSIEPRHKPCDNTCSPV